MSASSNGSLMPDGLDLSQHSNAIPAEPRGDVGDEALSQAGEALKAIILWATEGRRKKTSKAIALRLLAALRIISPASFDHDSLALIAKAEGVSRQILSSYSVDFQNKFLDPDRKRRRPPRMRPRGGLGEGFNHDEEPLHTGRASIIPEPDQEGNE